MAQLITDVMTPQVVAIDAAAPVTEAAKAMRDSNVGDVVVVDDGKVCGILTDRDVAIRAATGDSMSQISTGEICSPNLVTLAPESTVEEAIELMREHAIRRLPIVSGQTPVGFVSLGDLAVERDPASLLGAVSAAPPNP